MFSDVLIIGSGPAGTAAAIAACKAGCKTTIVSKPVQPAAGESNATLRPSESVHPGISSLLKMLDVEEVLKFSSRGIYSGITISGKHQPLGSDESGEWNGNHIDRNLFDQYLLDAAVKQGAALVKESVRDIVFSEDRITGVTLSSGKNISATITIDASGHTRIAGKKLGFREKFYSPPFFVWTGCAHIRDMSFFATAETQFAAWPNGWTWLAPERHDRCTWTRLSSTDHKDFVQPPELDAYGSTSAIIRSNRRWRAFRPLVKEGLLLCGDAGAIIDPSAGQGILNALYSGIKAGQCAAHCISNPAMESFFLAVYDDWFIGVYEEKVKQLRNYYDELGIALFKQTNPA